jgi:hypothetical protein
LAGLKEIHKEREVMKRATLFVTVVNFAAAVRLLFLPSGTVAAQGGQTPPAYNPYPPGIQPPDLDSEIARVRREVVAIESEALAQWRALPPPTLTGQPPTLQGTGMRANQLLGKLMKFDAYPNGQLHVDKR